MNQFNKVSFLALALVFLVGMPALVMGQTAPPSAGGGGDKATPTPVPADTPVPVPTATPVPDNKTCDWGQKGFFFKGIEKWDGTYHPHYFGSHDGGGCGH